MRRADRLRDLLRRAGHVEATPRELVWRGIRSRIDAQAGRRSSSWSTPMRPTSNVQAPPAR